MARLIIIIPLIALVLIGSSFAFSQKTVQVPKVTIEAEQINNESILIKWQNPLDTIDGVLFKYVVLKDINQENRFFPIASVTRNINEKILSETKNEMFYWLDKDVKPNNNYTYQILTTSSDGLIQLKSEPTNIISIDNKSEINSIKSHGWLISNRNIGPIKQISWFDWLNPFKTAIADNPSQLFTTSPNPQRESYRIALEPLHASSDESNFCNQVFEFLYSKNADDGQDFNVLVSVFETELRKDDNSGVVTSIEVQKLRYQKAFTEFSDLTKQRQKWMVIQPHAQTINNFTKLEAQFDITGISTINPLDHRTLTIWDATFTIPNGVNNC